MSGCDKSLSHGSPVNAVAKDTGSEATHSLTSNTSALVPSNTPAPTSEPQSLSDSAVSSSLISWRWCFLKINLDNPFLYYTVNVVIYAATWTVIWALFTLAIAGVYHGCYKPLYRFVAFNPTKPSDAIPVEEKDITDDERCLKDGYRECFFYGCHFYDYYTRECIDEIPVRIGERTDYYYQPNPSKLKTLLRKIFRIKSFTYESLTEKWDIVLKWLYFNYYRDREI
jgi:hypothetical protein